MKKKYAIEEAAEDAIKKFFSFFFVIPKNKMDKFLWLTETLAWILLTIVVFSRFRG